MDDNVDAANSLVQLLELYGHTTKAVYSAQDTLQHIKIYGADIILLDIGLPDFDGYEVAQKIRTFNTNVTLIALTGRNKAEDIQRSKEVGFKAHVTKPVSLKDLEVLLL